MKNNFFYSLLVFFVIAAGATFAAEKQFASVFHVEADDWTSTGGNSYFKLAPGYTLVLDGTEDGKKAHLTIKVLGETRTLGGVETRVVEERQTEDGQLVELARNYFAASKKTGNVYYFGEDVDTYKNGKLTGHGGSWHAGENGATFGLMMPGKPRPGACYYQELAGNVARDRAEIISVTESLETPAGRFSNCVKTEETSPLEKGAKEYKLYTADVGLVQDGDLVLTSYEKAAK